jgi:hypothetical protein
MTFEDIVVRLDRIDRLLHSLLNEMGRFHHARLAFLGTMDSTEAIENRLARIDEAIAGLQQREGARLGTSQPPMGGI